MPRKTAAEKAAEKAAEEAAAAEETQRRSERQRLTWAGLFLAAVALFAVGYAFGSSAHHDSIAGSDMAVAAQADNAVIPPGQMQGHVPGRGGRPDIDRAPGQGPSGTYDPAEGDEAPIFEPGYLGIRVQRSPAGVSVVEVAPDGPAAAAGLQPDDVVVSFDGVDVTTVGQLARIVRFSGAGTAAEIVVQRGGSEITMTVTLSGIPN